MFITKYEQNEKMMFNLRAKWNPLRIFQIDFKFITKYEQNET